MTDIPDWAGKRACELLNAERGGVYTWKYHSTHHAVRTVAKLVMQHEQPPIDPDEEAVKRIFAAFWADLKLASTEDFSPEALARAVSQYKLEKGNG